MVPAKKLSFGTYLKKTVFPFFSGITLLLLSEGALTATIDPIQVPSDGRDVSLSFDEDTSISCSSMSPHCIVVGEGRDLTVTQNSGRFSINYNALVQDGASFNFVGNDSAFALAQSLLKYGSGIEGETDIRIHADKGISLTTGYSKIIAGYTGGSSTDTTASNNTVEITTEGDFLSASAHNLAAADGNRDNSILENNTLFISAGNVIVNTGTTAPGTINGGIVWNKGSVANHNSVIIEAENCVHVGQLIAGRGAANDTQAHYNLIDIRAGGDLTTQMVYGGKVDKDTSHARNNTVNLTAGGLITADEIFGGKGEYSSSKPFLGEATDNAIDIVGGTVNTNAIYGGYYENSDRNKITVKATDGDMLTTGAVIGGYYLADDNTVTLDVAGSFALTEGKVWYNTTYAGFIYGGYQGKGNTVSINAGSDISLQSYIVAGFIGSSENTVALNAGGDMTLGGLVYAGSNNTVETGQSDDNAVHLSADGHMNVGGTMIAGRINADRNSIVIDAGSFEGRTIYAANRSGSENTVDITAKGNVVTGALYGGYGDWDMGGAIDNNHLTIISENGSVSTTGYVIAGAKGGHGNSVSVTARGDIAINGFENEEGEEPVANEVIGGLFGASGNTIALTSTEGNVVIDASVRGGFDEADNNAIAIKAGGDVIVSSFVRASDGETLGEGNSVGMASDGGSVVIGGFVDAEGTDNTVSLDAAKNVVIGGTVAALDGGDVTIAAGEGVRVFGEEIRAEDGRITLSANGNGSWIDTDVVADANGSISLGMHGAGYLNGRATTSDGAGHIDVSLTHADAVWNVNRSSDVNGLFLDNGARVNLGAGMYDVDMLSKTTDVHGITYDGVVLKVGALSGNGTFDIRLKIDGIGADAVNGGDLLWITDSASGIHEVSIPSAAFGLGGASVDGREELLVVRNEDGGQKVSFNLKDRQLVDIGPYTYFLRQLEDGDWYLGQLQTAVHPGPGDAIMPPIFPPDLNNVADVSTQQMHVVYLMNWLEIQTLNQRMGEVRQKPGYGDAWVRTYGGHLNHFSDSRLSGFSMDYFAGQTGFDLSVPAISENFYIGALAGYVDASPKFNRGGSGEGDRYSLGVYALYADPDDWYVDASVRFSHTSTSFRTLDSQGANVSGKGSTDGVTMSLEGGKRWAFDPGSERADSGGAAKKPFFIEPQGQIVYSRQGAQDINASNGLKTKIDGYDSTLLRASVLLGYNFETGSVKGNAYVKSSRLQELSARTSVLYNGTGKEDHSFTGGWWDNAIGVNVEVAKDHNIYAEIGYSKGGKFDDVRATLGYRWTF